MLIFGLVIGVNCLVRWPPAGVASLMVWTLHYFQLYGFCVDHVMWSRRRRASSSCQDAWGSGQSGGVCL